VGGRGEADESAGSLDAAAGRTGDGEVVAFEGQPSEGLPEVRLRQARIEEGAEEHIAAHAGKGIYI
jgi:hypothetical protein